MISWARAGKVANAWLTAINKSCFNYGCLARLFSQNLEESHAGPAVGPSVCRGVKIRNRSDIQSAFSRDRDNQQPAEVEAQSRKVSWFGCFNSSQTFLHAYIYTCIHTYVYMHPL